MTGMLLFPAMAQDGHAYDLLGLPDARTYVYPGHGARPGREMTLAELADDAMAAVTEPVDLVGVALGGIIAQHAIARHPDLVRSAVLANTPGDVSDRARLLARAHRTRAYGPDTDELLKRWLRPETIKASGPGVSYVRRVLTEIDWAALARIQAAMADHDAMSLLAGTPSPVTFVVGADDHVGVGSTERLAAVFTNARIRRIPGGHMLHLDNPTEFAEIVRDHVGWVDEIATRGRS